MDLYPVWPKDASEVLQVRGMLDSYSGVSIGSVTYQVPGYNADVKDFRIADGCDNASMGVELLTSDMRVLVLAWQMNGTLEGLGVGEVDSNRSEREERLAAVDASSSAVWRGCLGSPITGIACSWFEQSSEEYPSIMSLWSLRFDFQSDLSIVVALGEVAYPSNDVTYIPDNLVVLSDVERAKSYYVEGSLYSAWGA